MFSGANTTKYDAKVIFPNVLCTFFVQKTFLILCKRLHDKNANKLKMKE